mgnify:CR=1 FL=1
MGWLMRQPVAVLVVETGANDGLRGQDPAATRENIQAILDEATEGLAPVIRSEIWGCISLLKSRGQSILIVDKNLSVLKRIADRHFVIEKGRTVWRGSSADLDRDAALVHRYVTV